MRATIKAALAAVLPLALILSAGEAIAHHKPGHPVPPGHAKRTERCDALASDATLQVGVIPEGQMCVTITTDPVLVDGEEVEVDLEGVGHQGCKQYVPPGWLETTNLANETAEVCRRHKRLGSDEVRFLYQLVEEEFEVIEPEEPEEPESPTE